jgi:hypothetical protein
MRESGIAKEGGLLSLKSVAIIDKEAGVFSACFSVAEANWEVDESEVVGLGRRRRGRIGLTSGELEYEGTNGTKALSLSVLTRSFSVRDDGSDARLSS